MRENEVAHSMLQSEVERSSLTLENQIAAHSMHGCSLLAGQSFISGFYDVAKVAIIEKIIRLNNGYILDMKEGFKKQSPSIFLAAFWKFS